MDIRMKFSAVRQRLLFHNTADPRMSTAGNIRTRRFSPNEVYELRILVEKAKQERAKKTELDLGAGI